MTYRNDGRMFSPEPKMGHVRLAASIAWAAMQPRAALLIWHALRRTWCECIGFSADAAFHQRRFNELAKKTTATENS